MKAAFSELPVEMADDRVEMRVARWGEMSISRLRMEPGSDLSPYFEGLPENRCPVPHWGQVVEGEVHLDYEDGTDEVTAAGECFYWPPGHRARTETGAEVLLVSPVKAEEDVMRQLQAANS